MKFNDSVFFFNNLCDTQNNAVLPGDFIDRHNTVKYMLTFITAKTTQYKQIYN